MSDQVLQAIVDDLSELKDTIREMSHAISKLAVLDEKMLNQSQAIERSFAAISRVAEKLDQHLAAAVTDKLAHAEEHADIERSRNRAIGALAVLSVLSSGLSVYAVNFLNDLTALKAAVYDHINHDMVTTERDIRQVCKEFGGR